MMFLNLFYGVTDLSLLMEMSQGKFYYWVFQYLESYSHEATLYRETVETWKHQRAMLSIIVIF